MNLYHKTMFWFKFYQKERQIWTLFIFIIHIWIIWDSLVKRNPKIRAVRFPASQMHVKINLCKSLVMPGFDAQRTGRNYTYNTTITNRQIYNPNIPNLTVKVMCHSSWLYTWTLQNTYISLHFTTPNTEFSLNPLWPKLN